MPVVQPFDKERSAVVYVNEGTTLLGIVGEYSASTRNNLKLAPHTAGFEIDLEVLAKHTTPTHRYVPLPRFPQVTQDITFKIASDISHATLFEKVRESFYAVQPEHTQAALDTLSIYQAEGDSTTKHVTFRLTIASYQKTLRDSEVAELLDSVAASAHQTLSAERV